MSCCWTSWDGVRKTPLIEFFHQLGGHRFYPPDFCIVSKLRWRYGETSVWWPADLHHATVWSQLPPTVHELLVCRLWSGQSFIPDCWSAIRHHSLVHGGQQVDCACSASRHDGEGGTLLADWIPEQLFNWGEVRNCSAENQITNLWARTYGLNGEFISGYFILMGTVFFYLNNFRK